MTRTCLAKGLMIAGIGAMLCASEAPDSAEAQRSVEKPIIVTGTKTDPVSARREAHDFVRKTGIATGETPVARWIDRVCPRVFGLAPQHARIVEARLREIGRTVGVPMADAKCETNVAVVFAADGAAFARDIASRDRRQIGEVPLHARPALLQGSAPVRWWYVTEQRSKHGMSAASMKPPWTQGNAEGGGSIVPMNVDSTALQQYNSSFLSTQTARAITGATVVVDANRAEGVTLDAVADYAALVAFAEMRQAASHPDSVLSLFDADGRRELTREDAAFLTALYDLPLDRQAHQQRGHLVRGLVEATTGRD